MVMPKIRLAAAAVDGRANAALVELIAHRLDAPRAAVAIRSGEKSRRKLLLWLVTHQPTPCYACSADETAAAGALLGASALEDHPAADQRQVDAAAELVADRRRALALAAQGFGSDAPGFVGIEDAQVGRVADAEENLLRRRGSPPHPR